MKFLTLFKVVFFTLSSISLIPSIRDAQAAPECSIGDIKQWASGFVVRDVVFHNDSDRVVSSPRIRLVFSEEVGVQSVWGAIAEQAGVDVILTGNGYNSIVKPGGSARFGFKGVGRADGVTCQLPEEEVDEPLPINDGVVWRDDEIDAGLAGQRWRRLEDTRIVADCGGDRGQCLEVTYGPTSRGSDRLQTSVDIPPGTHYTLQYDIRFGSDFEFVRGGKLPGLSPENHTTGCKSAHPEKWSARPMWRVEGAAQGYYYGQDRSGNCGDGQTSGIGVFKPGRWQKVALRVKLNNTEASYDNFRIIDNDTD
ncbi:MAG: polysaccharide lyase [Granulosicoccus sp.]